jgi:hypothetical protein
MALTHLPWQPQRNHGEGNQNHQAQKVGQDKGKHTLEYRVKLTSCTTLLMTNTFIPTGG